jgi:hypothetical protein
MKAEGAAWQLLDPDTIALVGCLLTYRQVDDFHDASTKSVT